MFLAKSRERSVVRVEFDVHADDYRNNPARNITVTGEPPEFFSEYNIIDALAASRSAGIQRGAILDFGVGIGSSIPFFRRYFPLSDLTCPNASSRPLPVQYYVCVRRPG